MVDCAEVTEDSWQYRLRAAPSMPTDTEGQFVMHTFMAEHIRTTNYLYTNELPPSDEFRGRGGTYMSASFNRMENKGGNTFEGRIVHESKYVDEDDIYFD